MWVMPIFRSPARSAIVRATFSTRAWEREKATPTFPYWPKIIGFLGYSPYDPGWTHGERLTGIRRYLGLTQEAVARRLRVDPGTLARWERGEREPKTEHIRQMGRGFLSGSSRA